MIFGAIKRQTDQRVRSGKYTISVHVVSKQSQERMRGCIITSSNMRMN